MIFPYFFPVISKGSQFLLNIQGHQVIRQCFLVFLDFLKVKKLPQQEIHNQEIKDDIVKLLDDTGYLDGIGQLLKTLEKE